MSDRLDGIAIVYCEGAFATPNGKTAHGLVRRTRRYQVVGLVDSRHAGADAGEVLDGQRVGIPVFANLSDAIKSARSGPHPVTHLVVGLAPDGGRLPPPARSDIMAGIRAGLSIDCGLHDFLSEDPEIAALATEHGVTLRDVRKPPPRAQLHFFSGKIEQVDCLKVAVLGTDSAIGKRTTAVMLVEGLREMGTSAEMIGTGQTAWMQGVRYGIVLDALINDFVAGEIEHAVFSAWSEQRPDVIVIEGQGSLMNPAYPGGFEILAAGRPDVVVLQHAPARIEYDGFPGYPLHPLDEQIRAIEWISGKPVVAITINHEDLDDTELEAARDLVTRTTGLPAFDVLREGPAGLARLVSEYAQRRANEP